MSQPGDGGYDDLLLFQEMVGDYKRTAGAKTKKGFETFRNAFNVRVAQEHAKVDGGMRVHMKSLKMLETHYDRLYEAADQAKSGPVEANKKLHYDNLHQHAQAPPAHAAKPRPFVRPSGPAQFAGAVLGGQMGVDHQLCGGCASLPLGTATAAAPYSIAADAPTPQLQKMDFRAVCRSCGVAKGGHPKAHKLGPNCEGPCKCGTSMKMHPAEPPRGPWCTLSFVGMDVEPTPAAPGPVVNLGPAPSEGWRKICRSCGRTKVQHAGAAFGAKNCRLPCVKCGRPVADHADTATGWYCRHGGGAAAAAAAAGGPAVNGDGDGDQIMGYGGAEV